MRPFSVVVLRDSVKVNSVAPIRLIVFVTDQKVEKWVKQRAIMIVGYSYYCCKGLLYSVFSL